MKNLFTKAVIATLFVLVINLSESCNPCGMDAIYFKTQAISASVGKIIGVDTSGCCDEYVVEDFIQDTMSIRYDSMLLIVKSDIQTAFNEEKINLNFGISSAVACSPAENYDVFKEVRITSDESYSQVYPAGTLLNDMVSVSWDARVLDSKINNILINSSNDYDVLYFKFNVPPDEMRIHKITIEYIFTDGRVLRSVINGLKIGN
jgi:hypothetical protein